MARNDNENDDGEKKESVILIMWYDVGTLHTAEETKTAHQEEI